MKFFLISLALIANCGLADYLGGLGGLGGLGLGGLGLGGLGGLGGLSGLGGGFHGLGGGFHGLGGFGHHDPAMQQLIQIQMLNKWQLDVIGEIKADIEVGGECDMTLGNFADVPCTEAVDEILQNYARKIMLVSQMSDNHLLSGGFAHSGYGMSMLAQLLSP